MPTILLIDDEPESVRHAIKALRDKGFDVKEIVKSTLALKLLSGGKLKPDLILLDVMMPEMNGYEVYRQLQADDKTRNIPVIFLTGKDPRKEIMTLKELKIKFFIRKPVQVEILLSKVKVALPETTTNQESQSIVKLNTKMLTAQAPINGSEASINGSLTLIKTINPVFVNYMMDVARTAKMIAESFQKDLGLSDEDVKNIELAGLFCDVLFCLKPSMMLNSEIIGMKTFPMNILGEEKSEEIEKKGTKEAETEDEEEEKEETLVNLLKKYPIPQDINISEMIKTHPQLASEFLKNMGFPDAATIASKHHEKPTGRGVTRDSVGPQSVKASTAFWQIFHFWPRSELQIINLLSKFKHQLNVTPDLQGDTLLHPNSLVTLVDIAISTIISRVSSGDFLIEVALQISKIGEEEKKKLQLTEIIAMSRIQEGDILIKDFKLPGADVVFVKKNTPFTERQAHKMKEWAEEGTNRMAIEIKRRDLL